MGFNCVIIKIMIIIFGLLNKFTVCITIKKIITFPTWNSFLLFFKIIFSSFYLFFVMIQSHIFFYPFTNTSESL